MQAMRVSLLALVASLLGPGVAFAQPVPGARLAFPDKELPYEDGEPVLAGYHVETRATRNYLTIGGSLFGASYLASAIIAGAAVAGGQPDAPTVAPLAIPVAGPFITLRTAHAGTAGGLMLGLDGLAQLGGVILFASGLSIREKVLVLDTIPATARVEVGPGRVAVVGTF
jgi:hypothetical protein